MFWQAYLPYSREFSPKASQYSTASWTTVAQKLSQGNSVLRLAIGAISFRAGAYLSGSEWMASKGETLYGKALREMVVELEKPRKRQLNSLIAASRLLTFFEVTLII
jgi:hypothetical protein